MGSVVLDCEKIEEFGFMGESQVRQGDLCYQQNL